MDKTKYQRLQASSDEFSSQQSSLGTLFSAVTDKTLLSCLDDHNNSHQVDLLDLSLPDYEQSNKLNLPPTNRRRAMASLPSTRSRPASLSESRARKRVFFTLVVLCTILDITVVFLMLNEVFTLSKLDIHSMEYVTALFTPLIQSVVNFLDFIEFRAYDDLRKHGDLENGNQENGNQENGNQENGNQENGNQENGNQENGNQNNANQENANQENVNQENGNQENVNQENANQKNNNPIYIWPLWIYSAPLLLIMLVVSSLLAPVTMVITIGAQITINLVFPA